MKPEQAPLPVEFSDEPLIAWRCWFVLPDELLLRPILKRGLAWRPREAVEAVCPEHLHEVPYDDVEKCRCGIWTVCHPMLLDEVGWRSAPPKGVAKLPGIMVVGEVSLWGKVLQYDRGWRASIAYPRHLYVFTDNPMIAETLRERYGVPVEWGADAEQLRRMLPITEEDAEEASPLSVAEALLGVVDAGLTPIAVRELLKQALGELEPVLKGDPDERLKYARAQVLAQRGGWPREVFLRSAELEAVNGNDLAASRAAWSRLVVWQRERARKVAETVEKSVRKWSEAIDAVARGTRPNGQPYASSTLAQKRANVLRYSAWIDSEAKKVAELMAVEIPTYRAWRSMMRCEAPATEHSESSPDAETLETLEVWHQAMSRRQERLADHERAVAIGRHRLARDREAFEAHRQAERAQVAADHAALTKEREQLRQDVVAGVHRDHADLLREVGELEARRRGALAMLVVGRPPSPRPVVTTASEQSELATLRVRLRVAGITFDRIAAAADVSRSMVSHYFAGRSKSQRVMVTTKRLLEASSTLPINGRHF